MQMSDKKKDMTLSFLISFYLKFMKSKEIPLKKRVEIQSNVENESGITFERILESSMKKENLNLSCNPFENFLMVVLSDDTLERRSVIKVINKCEEEIGVSIEEIEKMS